MAQIVLARLLLASLALFAWAVRRFLRAILSGRPDARTDHTGQRLRSLMIYFFGQKKVVEKTSLPARRWPRLVTALGSKYHFLIFWGFIIITVGSTETLVQGLVPGVSLATLFGDSVARAAYTAMDYCNIVVL